MPVTVGIDVGSVAVKVLCLTDGRPQWWWEEPTRPDIARQCAALLREARTRCGSGRRRLKVCATGYGRKLVRRAGSSVSEIMANAVGAEWLWRHWEELEAVFGDAPVPAARQAGPFRTIVDVGGQDSKVITLDADGMIGDFAMNDRCAAGTGRFLEVMARVLEVDMERLDKLALRAKRPARITSACTVFAESEVVSLLADGTPRGEVAAGVFDSVAEQVAGLAARCGWQAPVLFDGGPSQSSALRIALGRRLGTEPAVPPCGQFATALGAALLASGASADQEAAAFDSHAGPCNIRRRDPRGNAS